MINSVAYYIAVLCILLLLTINGSESINSERAAHPKESKNPINNSKNSAAAIAQQYCEKYAEYRYVTKESKSPSHSTTSKGRPNRTMDCVNVVPLITGGVLTEPKEFPHMALIGFGKDAQNIEWTCGGSLISEKFILGAAQCGSNTIFGPARWALLGDLNITSKTDDAKPAIYEIVKIHDHPNYDGKIARSDITLYELNTTVAISAYVRPACIHTSVIIPVNTRASITGWGLTGAVEERSNHLRKATISILDDKLCLASYNTTSNVKYDPKTMICAGDLKEGKDTCQGDSGGPLQVPVDKQVCMWSIFGVSTFGPGICGNQEDGSVYTKVAPYLDWIQSIVWP